MSSHLARIGDRPRPAGGNAAAEAQAYCASVLEPLGFAISRHPFEFSKFLGGWATPMVALLVAIGATGLFLLGPHGGSRAPVFFGALVVIAGIASWGGRQMLRATATNLEAVRGTPRLWLVAHIDSKWQPVSMITRVVGVIGSVLSALAFVAVVYLRPDMDARWLLAAVWLFCLPLMLSFVGARNHGTLDNASGVATVLEAVEQLPRDLPIGVLISDAEELALAGAAAWARTRDAGLALNVDSIDDDGELVLMYSGVAPRRLVETFRTAAEHEGESMRVLRLIPGILTDHVALKAAKWETLTLSRGTIRTLQRIHTSRDTLAHMNGRGIAGAARVLARTVLELC